MKTAKTILVAILITVNFLAGCVQGDKDTEFPSWAIAPFVRPEGINPLLTPRETDFYWPLIEATIKWENGDIFNPAATVINDTICVLYRAEDRSGQGIGQRASRIGKALSMDGGWPTVDKIIYTPIWISNYKNHKSKT